MEIQNRSIWHLIVLLGILLSLVVPSGIGAVAASADDGAVSPIRVTDEIEGHLVLSVEQFRAGNRDAAIEHTTEVVEELGPVVVTEVSAVNETLGAELESAFQSAHRAAKNDTASVYATVVNETVLPLLDRARSGLASEQRLQNATFNAKVVAGLLERANAEYAEGVDETGTISEEMDYWAADAYADQATTRYRNRIRGSVSDHAAAELEEMFASLNASMAERAPPSEVSNMVGSIRAELAEYTGLEVQSGDDGSKTIERIESDLHEAVEAYAAGNPAKAKSIIKQTYLSNFEGIEGTLIEERPDLVEKLEADFNERLPGLIESNASVSEVRETVEAVEGRLHEAAEILAAQEDTEIDLGATDKPTSTAESTPTADSTTQTEAPGFGVLAAVIAMGLIGLARYRPLQ
ncbi:MAG: hypothetical protein ABEJ84_02585 [Halodesulfurarchaeum sp.]